MVANQFLLYPNGSIKTFSRGGSDITGALVASSINAKEYENWTDVSGVLIAEELIEIKLENDVLKVDGNMAIAWSGSLDFTVERSGKSLIGSAASGEGLVNVYRGTGKVLLAPVRAGIA